MKAKAIDDLKTKHDYSKHNLFINKLEYRYPDKKVKIWISENEEEGYVRFHFGKLPKQTTSIIKGLKNDNPFVWVNTNEREGDLPLEVELKYYPALAKYWFTKKVKDYLSKKVRISRNNFNGDFEYWHEEKNLHRINLLAFGKFTIKIECFRNSETANLWLSYGGISYVVKQNIEKLAADYELDTALIKNVIYNKQLHNFKRLPDSIRYNSSEIYPILRREIAEKLKVDFPFFKEKFKLTHNYEKISMFLDAYLNTDDFKKIIPHGGKWSRVKDNSVYFLKNRSRELQFGRGRKSSDIYKGIKENGSAEFVHYSNIKWFLIYMDNDSTKAETLKDFVSGKKGFVRLSAFTGTPPVHDGELDINICEGEDIVEEVNRQIKSMELNSDTAYFAFYLSPVQKSDSRPEKHSIYYKIKELLLKRDIMSQAIDTNKFNEKNFGLSMTNIGIAMTAKLGGVPWKLSKETDRDLIIGFGAYKSKKTGVPYIGSAFCFDNMGIFQEFDCWPAKQEWALHTTLAEAISRYREKNSNVERVIIHYFKQMRQRELRKIEELIDDLDAKVPLIVVRFNSSFNNSELIINAGHEKYLPENGCYVRLKNHTYLLYINSNESGNKCNDAPFPLKLSLQSNRAGLFDDSDLVERLMKQVYEFSLLHWRSIKQPRIPVTVSYPRIVAEVFPHFKSNVMPDVARRRLWFL